ncbi:prephenate dehydratase [Salirhabdus euzebyi]|uniref:Prephenate dehydratase n=1 Tax=Salirhabdus euzebyi TaxID=394506 RepID=A0A841PSI8_9BACI|nr:prephenate dehydratase [Salirhabdus euzebyi]MBB6451907.1 prephenate dehydratase [Salirhabdus euzebyi]
MYTVGYLGPKGTFTKMAVDGLFDNVNAEGFATIPACIDAVNDGKIDLGVVPLENAIEGSVHLTLDYLIHQVRLPIVAEAIVPIKQHLLVHPSFDGELKDITSVHSHSHAIAQCHQFIHKNLFGAEIHYTSSTGQAAQQVELDGGTIAAIGNELAAKEYGLKIWKREIHDYENNHTRFAVLQREETPIQIKNVENQGYKTTVLVTLPRDYAGALHQVLSAFSWRRMNLSRIESRPMKTGLGNYFFIIDVEQEYDHVLFPGVQAELEALGCQMNILGSYPTYLLSEDINTVENK